MLKFILLHVLLLGAFQVQANIQVSFYGQSVHLARYENIITQGFLRLDNQKQGFDLYAGIYYDNDTSSDEKITYTDKQASPFLGIQSKLILKTSRFYAEVRDVNRLGEFPDDREINTYELRPGLLGYNRTFYSNFFTEWYYNLFYSKLYDEKFIFQGWHKNGIKLGWLHFFNEILADSFDFTKQEQFTVDARPGLRMEYQSNKILIQLMSQYLIPIDHSGRQKEIRSTLVLFSSF